MQSIHVIDSHTGGEPTRVVTGGFPDLGSGSMRERLERLRAHHDDWRAASMLEPRGNDVLVGALLCTPVNPAAAAGVIFFNNTGYLGMCGHGTIGLVATLAYMGRIGAGEHLIETPVGDVRATLHDDRTVSVRNVPAYRHARAVPLRLDDGSTITGDIAWGGNWFFLVAEHGQRVAPDNIAALTHYTTRIRQALAAQGITGANGAEIDHIELFAEDESGFAAGPPQGERAPLGGSAADAAASVGARCHSRNFVLCPGMAYDRSPCGTGTSAKLACLAADATLAPGAVWRQASVIGSVFEGSYTLADTPGHIIPTIRGQAWISAEATLLLDPTDPYRWGIRA
ncbi:proline racemase family protein [Curvibacter sp. APW13]|uniref:proline racemase family protein n=1 Tax=Curvibacter sp. APW13 TaxID=3077236 RepID=UPI0028DE836C|nr:proline racemase family protein [Curvibacter sp. APW13]MDT8991275.1 proline racemase family protein [Curvibacter sp. APW13]